MVVGRTCVVGHRNLKASNDVHFYVQGVYIDRKQALSRSRWEEYRKRDVY